MREVTYILEHRSRLTEDVWELVLSGDTEPITAPGQFINVTIPGKYLRRPISICSWTEGGLILLIKSVGEGTRYLTSLPTGAPVTALTGLGNGFDLTPVLPTAGLPEPRQAVLAGGGIGIAPLYGLAKRLLAAGVKPVAALGFQSARASFYLEEFAALGCDLLVATEDGSLGVKGFVTDLLRGRRERTAASQAHTPGAEQAPHARETQAPTPGQTATVGDYVYSCGPLPMLRAVYEETEAGQFSFESRMGCGFGACMGCSLPVAGGGRKRICRDGPVFRREELTWQI